MSLPPLPAESMPAAEGIPAAEPAQTPGTPPPAATGIRVDSGNRSRHAGDGAGTTPPGPAHREPPRERAAPGRHRRRVRRPATGCGGPGHPRTGPGQLIPA